MTKERLKEIKDYLDSWPSRAAPSVSKVTGIITEYFTPQTAGKELCAEIERLEAACHDHEMTAFKLLKENSDNWTAANEENDRHIKRIQELESACREKDKEISGLAGIDKATANRWAKRITELEATVERLTRELSDAKDDLLFYEPACRYCLNPEVEDAWRHDHNGDGRFHWHHCIDPGDGLASDCAHSELLERVYQEGRQELEAENQKMAELLDQAPHMIYCHQRLGGKCDCWKKEADALLSRESAKS